MKLHWRIWLLIIVILASLLIISPRFSQGVVIKSVERNSTAYEAGLRANMIITAIDGESIKNLADYSRIMNDTFSSGIETNKTKLTITTKDGDYIVYEKGAPLITTAAVPWTNIKTGLDLSGGARALVKAEGISLNDEQLNDLISITNSRLNEFGIADVSVRPVKDLSGENFMLVEVAGASAADLEELLSSQGKFEAKIGDKIVFVGGDKDITYVARSGNQAGVYSCSAQGTTEFICNFGFTISLSEEAAKRHADITCQLATNSTVPQYLEKPLDLYLDGNLVDSLLIGRDLRCSQTTQIQISGSGSGLSREEAYNDAVHSMKQLQTTLITGSLPFKLEILKIDIISPALGKEFTQTLLFFGLFAFCSVSVVLFIIYRNIKITLAVILTMFSEAFITIGIAAMIGWHLDAPSIAGIIAGMGTGVNDQIVILDETISHKRASVRERIKNALFIIIGAFLTIIAAVLPLFWAGAGLLKGFALTTILGVSIGIFVTRPAFSEMVKRIVKE